MRRFELVRELWALRTLGCAGLVVLVPTLGAGLTCLAGTLPIALARWAGAGEDVAMMVATFVGLLAALGTMLGIGVVTLRLAGGLATLRAPFGEVTVGGDGIVVRELLTRRFVGFDEIEEVVISPSADAVVLHMKDGSEKRVLARRMYDLEEAARDALVRYRTREPGPRVRSLEVEAASASTEDFIAAAKALLDRADYRAEQASPELLVRVAEDPTAPPLQRIGSALALSKASTPLRARVRVAIDEVADPDVGRAMAQALDGDLAPAVLARALAGKAG